MLRAGAALGGLQSAWHSAVPSDRYRRYRNAQISPPYTSAGVVSAVMPSALRTYGQVLDVRRLTGFTGSGRSMFGSLFSPSWRSGIGFVSVPGGNTHIRTLAQMATRSLMCPAPRSLVGDNDNKPQRRPFMLRMTAKRRSALRGSARRWARPGSGCPHRGTAP